MSGKNRGAEEPGEWLEALLSVQQKIGYNFKNQVLLRLAMSHSSWASEKGKPHCNNERLEFLGDAVLELCVSAQLFRLFASAREGELTRIRASLVNASSLAEIATELGLPAALLLGRGEEQQGGRSRASVLSDALEALLAAVYEDGGFLAAQGVVNRIFAVHWPHACRSAPIKNYKSRLQELAQKRFNEYPVYNLQSATGPAHAKIFEVCLILPDGSAYYGRENSRKNAEQAAAREALKNWRE